MAKKTILFIMNESEYLSQLKENLELNGFEVIAEYNGRDGYETARKIKPALIIANFQISGLNGIDLCYMIRNSPTLSKTPIVLFASLLNKDERIESYRNGADDILLHSTDVREAIVRIENLLLNYEMLTKDNLKPTQSLTGKLSDFKLIEILQLLNLNQKTGILTIYHEYADGQIIFNNGEITFALVQETNGEPAVKKMIEWESGIFIFEQDFAEREKNISKPTMQLLLDCCQEIDESDSQGK
ncbi:hypothetical protein B6I21_05120 [candidate division KSB1 bacterium 4572_119]|nr:MAG: hypothetical protein B6I21_05120 [candidate division KSB1 bacterium 4572_119]